MGQQNSRTQNMTKIVASPNRLGTVVPRGRDLVHLMSTVQLLTTTFRCFVMIINEFVFPAFKAFVF